MVVRMSDISSKTFRRLGQPLKSPESKFLVIGKKHVRLFGVMTKTSVLYIVLAYFISAWPPG